MYKNPLLKSGRHTWVNKTLHNKTNWCSMSMSLTISEYIQTKYNNVY